MPIKGITDQIAEFPEIGQLRKGSVKRKRGNKEIWGEDLDHFRFTSEIPEVRAEFAEVYDGEPRMINVLLPHPTVNENFDAWQEEYITGGLVHRCDGETMVLWLDEDGSYSTEPKPCPYATGDKKRTGTNPGCKPTGRLKVIVIELQRMAYVTVLTNSIHDIRNLSAQLRALFQIRRDLTGIPMQLRRVQKTISTPGKGGKRVRRQKWLLSIEATPTYSKLQLAAQERAARPQLTSGNGDGGVVVDGETGEVLDGEEEPLVPDELFDEEEEPEVVEEDQEDNTFGQAEEEGEDDPSGPRPWAPETIKAEVEKRAARWSGEGLSDGQLKGVNNLLGKAVTSKGMKQADINRRRHRVLRYLAGVESSKDLSKGQASGIIEWLKDGPTWDIRPHAKAEVEGILAWVSRNGGQLTLSAVEEEAREKEERNFTPPPACLDVTVPRGELKGKKLSWVAINRPDYLRRIAEEAVDKELREAAQAALELMDTEPTQMGLF